MQFVEARVVFLTTFVFNRRASAAIGVPAHAAGVRVILLRHSARSVELWYSIHISSEIIHISWAVSRSRGSVLAFGTQVRGFAPGRSRRIFRPKKSSAHLPSDGEVKPSVPSRSFTACKRSLNVTCKSAFRHNYRTFLAHSSTFRRWVLSRGDTRGDAWWRKLERLTKIAQ
jgi:hypothetical protein